MSPGSDGEKSSKIGWSHLALRHSAACLAIKATGFFAERAPQSAAENLKHLKNLQTEPSRSLPPCQVGRVLGKSSLRVLERLWPA